MKKFLSTLSAITLIAYSSINVFAEETTKYDFSFNNGNITYNCTLKNDYINYDLIEHCNGIVFETENKTDINNYNLKYDFNYSNYAAWGTSGLESIVLGHNTNHSENVYSSHIDGDISELTEYANELSKMDGIKYAEVFTIDVKSIGNICYSSENDCRILIKGGENPEEYINSLNNNKELVEYLSSIGADPEVKILEKESEDDDQFLYISNIKNRTQYFDIYEKLRNIEEIGNNIIILGNVLATNSPIVDFIGRDYTGDANEDKYINVRDCAEIAFKLAQKNGNTLPDTADYNKDSKKDVRDAAAMARALASGIL
jgi:hypothetical protein